MFRKHVSNWLSAYCHGELTETAAQQVRAHLLDCARCRKEHEQISLGVKLAEQLRAVSAPTSLWPELVEKFAVPVKQKMFLPAWKYALVVTTAVLLMLSIWGVLRRKQENVPQVEISQRGHRVPETTPSPQVMRQSPSPSKYVPLSQSTLNTPTTRMPTWEVSSLSGAPRIGAAKIAETGKLPVGEWLETDNVSSAKLKVAEIGYVDIAPNSRLQLVETKTTEHRIALTKGKMSALILAPPRLFIVDTPSATAVDLGCSYTLEVDEYGASLLHVTSGWVSFVRDGQESVIPAGAMCATRKSEGVGTPYFADASASFKSALAQLDFGKKEIAQSALGTLLGEARLQDALTLWHLLGRKFGDQTGDVRGKVYDRLAELAPPPANVTREGVITGDRNMLDRWWGDRVR